MFCVNLYKHKLDYQFVYICISINGIQVVMESEDDSNAERQGQCMIDACNIKTKPPSCKGNQRTKKPFQKH